MKKLSFAVIAALILLLSLNSCEEDSKIYEVQIINECYMDVLNTGLPFSKIQIDEVRFNDEVVVSNLAAPMGDGSSYRTSSDFFTVESGIDYEVTVEFTTYYYDTENFMWETEGIQDEYIAGTETWTNDEEYSTFAMKFTTGGLFNAYRPEFETFYIE